MTKGLFTWRREAPGRWGSPLRWGKKNLVTLKIIEKSLSTYAKYGFLLSLWMMQNLRQSWIWSEFDITRYNTRLGGLPHLETFTWKNVTPAEKATRSGRPSNLPRLVTPPCLLMDKLCMKKNCVRPWVSWLRKFASAAEVEESGETCLPVVE